jgi:hypothetical protein
MTTHSRSLVSARDDWWTLDFANAFVSPGVNSRGELVPWRFAPSARGLCFDSKSNASLLIYVLITNVLCSGVNWTMFYGRSYWVIREFKFDFRYQYRYRCLLFRSHFGTGNFKALDR